MEHILPKKVGLSYEHICAFKSSTSKESSYKKTQECLEIVAQEFEFQGHHMIGPCAVAMASGHRGKRPGNISRDLKRKFERMIDDAVTCFFRIQENFYQSNGQNHHRVCDVFHLCSPSLCIEIVLVIAQLLLVLGVNLPN